MTTELIASLNTLLQPWTVELNIPVRLIGQVRQIEETRDKTVLKYPVSPDPDDTEPILPDSTRYALVIFWELRNSPKPVDIGETRTYFKTTVRVVAWYDSRKLITTVPLGIKSVVQRYLLHYLNRESVSDLPKPDGFQAVRLAAQDFPNTRQQLFGHYTFDNASSQFMTEPYDAIGIDFQLSFWLNHNCLPELNGNDVTLCS